mmetsp:Transcript_87742/g.251415  ORF Transcript_87742/g.251415 Transcript_87742/m.251415 type:complete len:221 (+) Transcript_87742:220-882(+)
MCQGLQHRHRRFRSRHFHLLVVRFHEQCQFLSRVAEASDAVHQSNLAVFCDPGRRLDLAHPCELPLLALVRLRHSLFESLQHTSHLHIGGPRADDVLKLFVQVVASAGRLAGQRPAQQGRFRLVQRQVLHTMLDQLDAPTIVAGRHGHGDVQRGLRARGSLVQVASGNIKDVVRLHGELHDGVAHQLLWNRRILSEHLLGVTQRLGRIPDGPLLLPPDLQ